MKYKLGLMAILLPILSFGQSPPIRQLTIGDSVPDIEIGNLINYKTASAKLSEFRGKLLILDFWATWCGSCIMAFPKLDSIQKKFGNKLQIMLVNNNGGTHNDKEKIKEFLKGWKIKTKGSFILPATTEENYELLKLFPHTFIPHYIWIGPQGKVIAITSYKEMTIGNIEAALNGTPNYMPQKVDSLKFHHQN